MNISRFPERNSLVVILAQTIMKPETDEILALCNSEVNDSVLLSIQDAGITEFDVLFIDGVQYSEAFQTDSCA